MQKDEEYRSVIWDSRSKRSIGEEEKERDIKRKTMKDRERDREIETYAKRWRVKECKSINLR